MTGPSAGEFVHAADLQFAPDDLGHRCATFAASCRTSFPGVSHGVRR